MPRRLAAPLLALTLALSGCGGEENGGPDMRPGENCLACHHFTAAGTVFETNGAGAGGVTVTISDPASGNVIRSLVTRPSGNFHTSAALGNSFTLQLSRGGLASPQMTSSSGACNHCHVSGGAAGGHLVAP